MLLTTSRKIGHMEENELHLATQEFITDHSKMEISRLLHNELLLLEPGKELNMILCVPAKRHGKPCLAMYSQHLRHDSSDDEISALIAFANPFVRKNDPRFLQEVHYEPSV